VTYVLALVLPALNIRTMNQTPFKINKRHQRGRRRGVAAVEAAFCIPIVILLMFGTLEACSAIFLRESLTVAAYEGARVGVRRRATFEMVEDQCNAVLEARGIVNATVTITPNDFNTLSALEPITVTVSAPLEGNSSYVFNYFSNRQTTSSVSMMREFDD